ncbi:hypothetical protein I7I50_09785 [Histoplasma capsulatum G186AR]|uniref:Uncharacterized protein n=1 Tax=Ajellomyces capsulatus TaxID=5037 RepID=A0A8H8D5B3_AJECA|nr:hypothetical protein I7I52_10898 [Histoplasma capsulatum]QSS68723.1 hypothetical protein I7I50_09785 [Histoplasma capsulatum G186AR]
MCTGYIENIREVGKLLSVYLGTYSTRSFDTGEKAAFSSSFDRLQAWLLLLPFKQVATAEILRE